MNVWTSFFIIYDGILVIDIDFKNDRYIIYFAV